MREINPVEIAKLIQMFLQKYCKYKKIDLTKITIFVYYKKHAEGVFWENAEVNEQQKKACYSVLLKMLETKKNNNHGFEDNDMTGAVSWKDGIVVMAGVENTVALSIISETLHYLQVMPVEEYNRMQKDLNQKQLFTVLKKGKHAFTERPILETQGLVFVFPVVFILRTNILE